MADKAPALKLFNVSQGIPTNQGPAPAPAHQSQPEQYLEPEAEPASLSGRELALPFGVVLFLGLHGLGYQRRGARKQKSDPTL